MEVPKAIEQLLSEIQMVFVKGGQFEMGDQTGELWEACRPVHSVTIQDFYLSKYLVTQELWQAIMGNNPARFKGAKRPVEEVSWEDAQQFVKKLNTLSKNSYRLPNESEWEYAARGGVYSQGYIYSGSDKLSQVGWYDANSNDETHEVGQKLANELGLYDMSGNVYEWCEDDWHGDYGGAPDNGSAWIDSPRGANRVVRGGGWIDDAVRCRPASRVRYRPGYRYYDIGFRLAMSLQSVG
ncbi:MAG: formylglycine-generating enzyme family protein [Bacteroidota bacterium]